MDNPCEGNYDYSSEVEISADNPFFELVCDALSRYVKCAKDFSNISLTKAYEDGWITLKEGELIDLLCMSYRRRNDRVNMSKNKVKQIIQKRQEVFA